MKGIININDIHKSGSENRPLTHALLYLVCIYSIGADLIMTWIRILFSQYTSFYIILFLFVAPFILRNISVLYTMTSNSSRWNEHYLVWRIFLCINLIPLYYEFRQELVEAHNLIYNIKNYGRISFAAITLVLLPFLFRVISYIYMTKMSFRKFQDYDQRLRSNHGDSCDHFPDKMVGGINTNL